MGDTVAVCQHVSTGLNAVPCCIYHITLHYMYIKCLYLLSCQLMNSKLDFCKTTLVWIQEIMFSNIVLVVHIYHVHVFIQGTSGCTLYSQTWLVPCKYNSTTCTSWTCMPNIANVNKVQYTMYSWKYKTCMLMVKRNSKTPLALRASSCNFNLLVQISKELAWNYFLW